MIVVVPTNDDTPRREAIVVGAFCAVLVAILVGIVVIPWWMDQRKRENEGHVLGELRELPPAQGKYREGYRRDKQGKLYRVPAPGHYAASLKAHAEAGLIDPVLASGVKHGYVFRIETATADKWSVTAVPTSPEFGDRSHYWDETWGAHWRLARDGKATRKDVRIGADHPFPEDQ